MAKELLKIVVTRDDSGELAMNIVCDEKELSEDEDNRIGNCLEAIMGQHASRNIKPIAVCKNGLPWVKK